VEILVTSSAIPYLKIIYPIGTWGLPPRLGPRLPPSKPSTAVWRGTGYKNGPLDVNELRIFWIYLGWTIQWEIRFLFKSTKQVFIYCKFFRKQQMRAKACSVARYRVKVNLATSCCWLRIINTTRLRLNLILKRLMQCTTGENH